MEELSVVPAATVPSWRSLAASCHRQISSLSASRIWQSALLLPSNTHVNQVALRADLPSCYLPLPCRTLALRYLRKHAGPFNLTRIHCWPRIHLNPAIFFIFCLNAGCLFSSAVCLARLNWNQPLLRPELSPNTIGLLRSQAVVASPRRLSLLELECGGFRFQSRDSMF